MLFELEVLETRRIAGMALEARKIGDQLLEKSPESQLWRPAPARGEHGPAGSAALMEVQRNQPEIRALWQRPVAGHHGAAA